jgi:uncharacterized RDD family membrane protein YckC
MSEHTAPSPSASLARRLIALLYDGLLLVGLLITISAIGLAVSGGVLGRPDRPEWLHRGFQLVLLASAWLFFAWFWTHGGQTLGMRAWRLQLVRADGGPVRWSQTLRRFAGAALSVAAFGLGFLWVLVDPQRLTWHDHLSGTRVILLKRR